MKKTKAKVKAKVQRARYKFSLAQQAENREAWARALCSGGYRKCTGYLCKTNKSGEPVSYCALGVACDLYLRAGYKLEVTAHADEDDGRNIYYRAYDRQCTVLPQVADWLGITPFGALTKAYAEGDPLGGASDIVDANDHPHMRLSQIAKQIILAGHLQVRTRKKRGTFL